jgi:serine/threonine protein kinase/Tol biopolymer transport system component
MSSDRWEQINRLYYAALEVAEKERTSFLSEVCGADGELRREVESLLAMHAHVDGFLEKPAVEEVVKALKEEPPSLLGRKLGHYQILGVLGAGGMGEVYKARDTQLGRYVAIKVLPSHLVSDPERKKRFVHEAKAASALNHPNIVTIHEIASDNGMNFLVMEHVVGKTLDELIPRRGMRLKEALTVAIQIAEALAAAHAVGIIHRDLKPTNIMVAENGQVKVLDFGVAKLVDRKGSSEADETCSTGTNPKTEEGVILGTVSYMSPEQAEGKKIDARSDIFSFGCVLYEMVTGRKAFQRDSKMSTLAAILREEPRLASQIAKDLPLELERIITRCLKKDPRRRFQHVGDVQVELVELKEEVDSGALASAPPRRLEHRSWRWALAGVLAIGLVVGAALWWRSTPPSSQPLIRLSVELPDFTVTATGPSAVLSPDGTRVAYTGRGVDGKSRLYTRRLDQGQAAPLAGTENCEGPFFSPNGQWIGFFANEGPAGNYKLKRISVEGGAAIVLADAVDSLGGSWGEDGNIITALDLNAGLSRVPSGGGKVQPVMESQPLKRKLLQMFPQVLPGAQAVLFSASTAYWEENEFTIDVQSLRTGEMKTLVRPGYCGRYAPSGHLLYIRQGTLYAAPMDLKRLELTGPVAQVVENEVTGDGFDINFSRNGTLVYVAEKASKQTLMWLDGAGHTQPLRAAKAKYFGALSFSPDGKRLAVGIEQDGNADLWVYEWERDSIIRLTFTPGIDGAPVWSSDGKHILFTSTRHGGPQNLYWMRADGAGEVVRLTESKNMQLPSSFSPDGKHLAFQELDPQMNWDLWTLPLEEVESDHPKPAKPEPFLITPFNEWFPKISPDGQWLAYNSNESGRLEIHVRRFPGPGGKSQISTDGGNLLDWSKKRQELYYLTDQGIMVANYTTRGEAFVPAKPRLWAEKKDLSFFVDLTPDGKRFAIVQEVESKEKSATHVMFLLNFFDELRRRAPAGGK